MTNAAVQASTPEFTRARLLDRVQQSSGETSCLPRPSPMPGAIVASVDCSISPPGGRVAVGPAVGSQGVVDCQRRMYAPPKPIDRLDEAIVLIGLRELRSVILAAATAEFINQLSFSRSACGMHCATTAA